jgi:hypothetical protein
VTRVEDDDRFVGLYARKGDVNKALPDLASLS